MYAFEDSGAVFSTGVSCAWAVSPSSAAAMSAAYNVRINLLSIKDEAFVNEKRLAVAELLGSVETDMDQISEAIEKALA